MPEYRFKVSDALAEDFHNGRTYYAERDRRVVVPGVEVAVEQESAWVARRERVAGVGCQGGVITEA